MRVSESLFLTEREVPSNAQMISHQLLIRTGLVRQISAGIYSLTPLALRVIRRITNIVKEEMNRVGGQEILLPVVQPAKLWQQSGRYEKIDNSLARWVDRNGQDMVLAMTHEESVTDLARHYIRSYRQLPMMLYQVQMKFRDEARPRGGLVRLREFLMKDAYSYHVNEQSLQAFYAQMLDVYDEIFRRCSVPVLRVHADTGMMGGGVSHEYMVISESGEDTLIICNQCGYAANQEVAVTRNGSESNVGECVYCGHQLEVSRGIEAGNTFQLGTYYSEPMQATFTDADGAQRPFIMGCYGIGITRLLACIIETNHDDRGIIWPESVAPYPYHLVSIGTQPDVLQAAGDVYNLLRMRDQVFYDDRSAATAGTKFTDAELLGIPNRLTVSKKSLSAGGIELTSRRTGETRIVSLNEIVHIK